MPASQLSMHPLKTRAGAHASHLAVADEDAWLDRRGRLLPAGPLELRLHIAGFKQVETPATARRARCPLRWPRLIAANAMGTSLPLHAKGTR